MRTSLFVSSLFAVSLVGAVAHAEATRSLDNGRTHGDTLDKNYHSTTEPSSRSHGATTERTGTMVRSPVQGKIDQRINCAEGVAECAGSSDHGAKRTLTENTTSSKVSSSKSFVNPLESKENERVNCNEGDECSASSKGAKAIWAKGRGDGAEPNKNTEKAAQAASQKMDPAFSERMSCNEGEECSFSSKAAAKIWRTEAFKHGTVSSSYKGDQSWNSHAALKEKMEHKAYAKAGDKSDKKPSEKSGAPEHSGSGE